MLVENHYMTQLDQNSRFFQPAEWTPHRSVWTAFPWDESLWEKALIPAQFEFANLCRMISNDNQGELLEILVPDAARERQCRALLKGINAQFHHVPFGDIWLRDIAPIFLLNDKGQLGSARFAFNGWGGKYILPHDAGVAPAIQEIVPVVERFKYDWVLEGGSVEVDGEGTCLTSEQCLLNPNRHPEGAMPTREEIEERLKGALGVQKVLWIKRGLLNDHTDGHIDTIARFIAPATVAIMMPDPHTSLDDPNSEVYREIRSTLEEMTDARGRKIKLVEIPSPGKIISKAEKNNEQILAASYLNFFIGNSTIVVPIYGSKRDDEAVEKIGAHFPGRRAVGVMANSILEGGGAFHCITQQVPQ